MKRRISDQEHRILGSKYTHKAMQERDGDDYPNRADESVTVVVVDVFWRVRFCSLKLIVNYIG